jgi:hypothetical protein
MENKMSFQKNISSKKNTKKTEEDFEGKNRDNKKKKLHKKLFYQNNKNIYLEEAENYLKYLFKINASQEEIDHAKNSIKKEKMLEDQE